MWRNSHVPKALLWNPIGKGWTVIEDGSNEATLFQKSVAPQELRNITQLYCSDGTFSDSRKCLSVGLRFALAPFLHTKDGKSKNKTDTIHVLYLYECYIFSIEHLFTPEIKVDTKLSISGQLQFLPD